jgi:hypothetical protein
MTTLLALGRGTRMGTPDGQQMLGLEMHRAEVQRRLGVVCELIHPGSLREVAELLDRAVGGVAMVMVSWRERVEDLIELFSRVRLREGRPAIVFLDYYAPTCSPHFPVLPHVDLYVKRQVLRDRAQYQSDYAGGYVVTDYLARHMGYDLHDWHFGSPVDPAQADKIVHGWNLGVTPRYRRIVQATRGVLGKWLLPWKSRRVDINRRFCPAEDAAWYSRYRRDCLAATVPLEARHICSPSGRIPTRRYLWEMMHSRIALSPFGWGELCFRDYEAVACGALLVKPSMSHLETSPDIYVEGETYVPVRWDFSDLRDKCEYYLSHEDEAERIAANAQAKLASYFGRGGFCDDLGRILSRVAPAPRRGSPGRC